MIRRQLYGQCSAYVRQRLQTIHDAIKEAQDSANSDSKSSAGDKHETGRSMAQLEQEKLSAQLAEAEKIQHQLSQVPLQQAGDTITSGSVVITDRGNYYIAISAGKLVAENETYFAVSPASPIGTAFYKADLKNGFVFNNQHFSIKKVF